MHFLPMISYYNFRTLKETRKHTSASDKEKLSAQLPFYYKLVIFPRVARNNFFRMVSLNILLIL